MSLPWFGPFARSVWRSKLLRGLLILFVLIAVFLVEEHFRGRIALAGYIRNLKSQGEKLTAKDFALPVGEGENGAPQVLALSKELKPGTALPGNYPPRMKLTAAGNAIVGFREQYWVDAKVTNTWEQLAKDLQTNHVTLETIRLALSKPVLKSDYDLSLGAHAPLKHLPIPKQMATWFGSEAQLALHTGKTRDALPALLSEIDLSRMLTSDGIVISELVRDGIASVARSDCWEALQAGDWNDEDLSKIQQVWARQTFLSDMVRAVEGERIFAQITYDQMQDSNEETVNVLFGMEDFLETDQRPKWETWMSNVPGGERFAVFLKKQIYARIWRFAWLKQDELRYLSYAQQLRDLGRAALQHKSLKKLKPALDNLVAQYQIRGFYNRLRYRSEMSIGSLSRVYQRAIRAETERSLVLAAAGLRRYKLRNNRPPANLSALVPESLEAVPIDYMDGEPIKYILRQEGSTILYSVGEDGIDNAGDATPPPGKTLTRVIWNRKDAVWAAPATDQEIQQYRAVPDK
jgi:hypothetical protein